MRNRSRIGQSDRVEDKKFMSPPSPAGAKLSPPLAPKKRPLLTQGGPKLKYWAAILMKVGSVVVGIVLLILYILFRQSPLKILPWNPLYRVPDSMLQLGDRSDRYVLLRKETDAYLADPANLQRHLEQARSHPRTYQPRPIGSDLPGTAMYDIYNCPQDPPAGYPYGWKTVDILEAWPVDQMDPPEDNGVTHVHQSLCVFDYQRDYEKAMRYRDAAVPFIVFNDPSVLQTVARWAMPNYMERMLASEPHRTAYSENNHFLYHEMKKNLFGGSKVKIPEGWKEPTKEFTMTYESWLKHANVPPEEASRDKPHWYFRLVGCGLTGNDGSCEDHSSELLYDELPFFQPKKSLYIVDPNEQEGIHCRFGMRNVIAENHYDEPRNAIALLGGTRRYILAHPDQCPNLALFPNNHPSARHSAVDFSNPDLTKFPEFAKARGNEVVMQPGQVLYLPSNWFHHIISLELNYQCNTRSGLDRHLMNHMDKCGLDA